MDSAPHLEMNALLDSFTADRVAAYANTGRKFKSVSDDQLVKIWQSIWEYLADDPLDAFTFELASAVDAEFALRGADAPFDLVKKGFLQFAATLRAHLEKIKNDDPDAFDDAEKSIAFEVEKFRRQRKDSN